MLCGCSSLPTIQERLAWWAGMLKRHNGYAGKQSMIKWASLSLMLHLCAAGLLIAAGLHPQQPEPVLIDLTMTPVLLPAGSTVEPKAAPAHKTGLTPHVSRQRKAETTTPPLQQPDKVPSPQQDHVVHPKKETVPQSRQTVNTSTSDHNTGPPIMAQQAGKTPAVTTVTASTGQPTAEDKARSRYQQEHFGYIRDLIMQQLTYPQLARRRGWSGRVVLAFVVAEDGNVRSIKVKESSGYSVLDTSAVETVKNVAPFPKPPLLAEITIPVVFRLH